MFKPSINNGCQVGNKHGSPSPNWYWLGIRGRQLVLEGICSSVGRHISERYRHSRCKRCRSSCCSCRRSRRSSRYRKAGLGNGHSTSGSTVNSPGRHYDCGERKVRLKIWYEFLLFEVTFNWLMELKESDGKLDGRGRAIYTPQKASNQCLHVHVKAVCENFSFTLRYPMTNSHVRGTARMGARECSSHSQMVGR